MPQTAAMAGSPPPVDSPPHHFFYRYRSNGTQYELKVPLRLPLTCSECSELAIRLVSAHRLPCYLEDELKGELERFSRRSVTEMADSEAEEKMYGGSVFEKGSETDQTIAQWVDCYRDNYIQFSVLADAHSQSLSDDTLSFSLSYHQLIHSPALETLLQLEHTYAMAVGEVCKAWDNARSILQKKHDSELNTTMKERGEMTPDSGINSLIRKHTNEREACEARWSSELSQLQETQRKEYREWVHNVHEEQQEEKRGEGGGESTTPHRSRVRDDSDVYSSNDFNDSTEQEMLPLEESFTIHLGTQMKMMHNMRLLCGNPLSLCQHKTAVLRGTVVPHPERLQTAMSLFSQKLSAIVLMVDGRVNSLGGMKEAFAKVCHQSTEFHFDDIDAQLSQVAESAASANEERREGKLQTLSLSSQNSDGNLVGQCDSPPDVQERGYNSETSSHSSQQLLSPDYLSERRRSSMDYQQTLDHRRASSTDSRRSSSLPESTLVSLEPGDFYITQHSNLSQVHVVFHLVTDDAAVQSSSLRTRHPVMVGLKNCLRAAARHDIHHITIPLLLVDEMQPEMTINWCHKRAELVFKCVKGFMLENTSWGESGSRTIQFLIPPGISGELFHEFCELLPKIYRTTTTRNLTTRTRGYSYK